MDTQTKNTTQNGFTIFEIVLTAVVIVLVGTVGVLAYKRTSQNANVNTTSTTDAKKKIAVEDKAAAEAEKVAIAPAPEPAAPAPAPAPVVKPTPPPAAKTEKTYTKIPLTLNDIQITDTTLQFGASWSGTHQGTCALTFKNLDTATHTYKEVPVNGSSCSFEVARADYAPGNYKYLIYFYSKDGLLKAEGSYKTITL